MTTNPQDDLLKYFWPHPYPSSHPPTQVVFNNGLPESDHDRRHKVFVMPYNTFKTAVEAEIVKRERLAEDRLLDELEATFDGLWNHEAVDEIRATRQALKTDVIE